MGQGYQVIVDLEAMEQLKQIVEWIKDNHSLVRADKVRNAVLDAIDSLTKNPTRHPIVRSVSVKGRIYRRILAERYRIVYTIFEETLSVKIVDIDHEKRDPQLLISKLG